MVRDVGEGSWQGKFRLDSGDGLLDFRRMDRERTPGYELYFAYGSNMLEQRLKDRVESAKFLWNAWIRGYEVRCRKKSGDKSGKADLVKTGNPDIVHGVVYEFDPADWPALDGVELGYDRAPIRVHNDTSAFDVTTYLARVEEIDESRVPYTWYMELILCGAEQHGLPEDYRERLGNIHGIPDPKDDRKSRKRAEKQIREYRAAIGR